MHHRMILIDDLTTGRQTRIEYTAEDVAAIYGPGRVSLLDAGQTVRIGHTLHCDMLAFINEHRQLPDAMTRPPALPGPKLAVSNAALVDAISIATDDATLADLAAPLMFRARPRKLGLV